MIPRMNIFHAAPEAVKGMMAVEATVAKSGLEDSLAELVRLRASQINGCAYCLHLHVKEATAKGETDMRIHMLDGWRHSPAFTDASAPRWRGQNR